ncbi:hypothetical protein JW933_10035 [candidate division FCPU426 bacterium]|nr:hypothetical protein [candidate division FCPU426 bacterium]
MTRVRVLLTAVCLFGLSQQTAQAIPSLAGKFIFSLNPGIGFYAPDDMNRLLQDTHSAFMGVVPSETLKPITLGLDLGTSLQYALMDFLILGLDVTYLVADTSAKATTGVASPPQDQYYIVSLPALEIGVLIKTALPLGSSWLLSAGAGGSYLSLAGAGERLESRGRLTGLVYSSSSIPYSAATLGYQVRGGLDFFIWEWLSLGVEVGYRWAKFEEVQACIDSRSITLKNPDNSNFTLDYSGVFTHYAFRFYF